jgi:nucleotide-binding universal stress UspA family protein
VKGPASAAIRNLASRVQVSLSLMGKAGHRIVPGFMIGNTAENLLQATP